MKGVQHTLHNIGERKLYFLFSCSDFVSLSEKTKTAKECSFIYQKYQMSVIP